MITHEEFQFNAKVLGHEIADKNNAYDADELYEYFSRYFNDAKVHQVPNELFVNSIDGNTFCIPNQFISFPKKLQVNGGNLDVNFNISKVLSNEVIVSGYFHALHSCIETLPEKFIIGDNVVLGASNIKVLPDNFIVNGSLNLINCPYINQLPKNLFVKDMLLIHGTNINEIPNCTKARIIYKEAL